MESHLHDNGSFTLELSEEELHELDIELHGMPLPARMEELRREVDGATRLLRYRRLR